MHQLDYARAVTTAVAFCAQLAGHYIGDHWVQTSGQARKKALNGGCAHTVALWHCVKHVTTWTATTMVFLVAAGWWLSLPLRPWWLLAGVTVNAVTHLVADLRTPLIWLARLLGSDGYLKHSTVMRPAGEQSTGPGTGLFHLDQSWHIGWLFAASLLIAGS